MDFTSVAKEDKDQWLAIATAYLAGTCDMPFKFVIRHAPRLAEQLADVADSFSDDMNQHEEDAKAAAEDAYWEQRIDEARGK